LSNDGHGQIQLFSVSPNGGPVLQITHHPFSIQSQFNFSPDDRLVVYLADNRIYITDLVTHTSMSITARFADHEKPVGAIVWSNNGQLLAYNRLVVYGTEKHPQIFILKGTCNFP
jgi:WD40 repeat protein